MSMHLILVQLLPMLLPQSLLFRHTFMCAVTADELEPLAKVTGLPEMQRKGMGHNLNMRAASHEICKRKQQTIP